METNNKRKNKVEIKSIHKGHRQRVRNKFIKHGLESFTEVEALEFLLFHSIPYKDTNEIAHALINKFGSLEGVMKADIRHLTEVNGISTNSAALISLFNEFYKYIHVNANIEGVYFSNVHVAGRFCCNYFMNHLEEAMIVISTDSNRKVKCIDVVSEGILTSTPVYFSRIIDVALKNKTATIYIAHNHPSNNPEPSPEDITYTQKLQTFLKDSGIHLLDHIICSGNNYVSLSDKGYI